MRNTVLRNLEDISATQPVDEPPENTLTNNALAFLYLQTERAQDSVTAQFEEYLAEPQLRFDLNYCEWWKTREKKYPLVAALAKKYLCIPATSTSSERTFSTAGNIITSKRNCLNPETVNMLVFLFQNKHLY